MVDVDDYDTEQNQEEVCWPNWDRPFIAAVDLDGTLFKSDPDEWEGPGHFLDTIESTKKIVKFLDMLDYVWIVIWTCRPSDEGLREELEDRGIPFDSINEHPFEPKNTSRKMTYDILLGDSEFRFIDDLEHLMDFVVKVEEARHRFAPSSDGGEG